MPFPFLEKIGRAQIRKARTFFFGVAERSERRRGGSFLVRMFVKVGSDFNQKVPLRKLQVLKVRLASLGD
ncbi:MAG: hypothetical protein AAB652_02130 [Patescibacteria group bacterium]